MVNSVGIEPNIVKIDQLSFEPPELRAGLASSKIVQLKLCTSTI